MRIETEHRMKNGGGFLPPEGPASAGDGEKDPYRCSMARCESWMSGHGIRIRYDLLRHDTEVEGMPEGYSREQAKNTLPVLLLDELSKAYPKNVSFDRITGWLQNIADRNRFNPVEEYLTSGEWDGADRFGAVCDFLGIRDDGRLQTYVRKWLIQCAALGCNSEESPVGAEGVLVLQGPEGGGKTSFFRRICPRAEWFREGLAVDLSNKDSIMNAIDCWIAELGELEQTMSRRQPALKSFVTSASDSVRRPYAAARAVTARRTSFCATVNSAAFLKESAGERRWWVVPVGMLDVKRLDSFDEEFLRQLWYQAYALYRREPGSFRLDREELAELRRANGEFAEQLPYEEDIRHVMNPGYLAREDWPWVTAADIKKEVDAWLGVRITESRAVNLVADKLIAELHGGRVDARGRPEGFRLSHHVRQYRLPLIKYDETNRKFLLPDEWKRPG